MARTQYYVFEIQQYADGTYGDLKHIAYDEDPDMARRKAESKYHEVLAAAAISNIPSHAAVVVGSDGFPILHQCYTHEVEPEE